MINALALKKKCVKYYQQFLNNKSNCCVTLGMVKMKCHHITLCCIIIQKEERILRDGGVSRKYSNYNINALFHRRQNR